MFVSNNSQLLYYAFVFSLYMLPLCRNCLGTLPKTVCRGVLCDYAAATNWFRFPTELICIQCSGHATNVASISVTDFTPTNSYFFIQQSF